MSDFAEPQGFMLDPISPVDSYGVAPEDTKQVLMLDFRGYNGTSFSLPYSQLRAMVFDPDEGISVEFSNHKIQVRGRNLRPLYDLLLRHRVTFVQEGDLDVVSEADAFVDRITVGRSEELS